LQAATAESSKARSQDSFSQTLSTSQLQSSTGGGNFGNLFGSPTQGNTGGPGGSTWGSLASSSGLNTGGGAKELQRSHYQSGYLMSSMQNQQTQNQPSSFSEDPPLLSTKSHGHSHTSPHFNRAFGHNSEFGTDNLFQRSTTRMDMNDEDAPPTTSLHDSAVWAPTPSTTPLFKSGSSSVFGTPSRPSNQKSNPLTPNAPTEKPKPHYLTVFGYPASSQIAFTHLSDSFSALATGEFFPAEADENGGNWFTIGYLKQADAKRALARDGEIVRDDGGNLRYMIGVRWRDHRVGEVDFASSGLGTLTNGSTKALVRTGGFGTGSPLQPAAAAFRKPEPPKASSIAVDQGVAGMAGVSPSNPGKGGWVGTMGDMIFGW